jgi:cardiolipin synthase A/B
MRGNTGCTDFYHPLYPAGSVLCTIVAGKKLPVITQSFKPMPLKKSAIPVIAGNRVALVNGGRGYFDLLLHLIDTARQSIHLQTYIFEEDETGMQVAQALINAAQRNVAVYLLADGYASQSLSARFISQLKEAGVHFRFFEPLFKSRRFYVGRRLHHKVMVADAAHALVGGINISNRYNDRPGKPAWLDFALHVHGPVVVQLCVLCWKTWKGFPVQMEQTTCETNPPEFFIPATEQLPVAMCRNDWVRRKNEISTTYVQMLRTAKKEVILLCSYFLPGKMIRRQIAYAIKRGVKVKVVAAGVSDVWVAKYAERWLYDWLLRMGVELYEYKINVLHGKLAVCDNEWMTLGSYNINNISAYASIELNLNVQDAAFTANTRMCLQQIITTGCQKITGEHLQQTRHPVTQLIRWLCYQFVRLVFFLFTFYYKHRR